MQLSKVNQSCMYSCNYQTYICIKLLLIYISFVFAMGTLKVNWDQCNLDKPAVSNTEEGIGGSYSYLFFQKIFGWSINFMRVVADIKWQVNHTIKFTGTCKATIHAWDLHKSKADKSTRCRGAQKSIIAEELLATDNLLEKMHQCSLRVWPLVNWPHSTRTSRPGEVLIALDGLKQPIRG